MRKLVLIIILGMLVLCSSAFAKESFNDGQTSVAEEKTVVLNIKEDKTNDIVKKSKDPIKAGVVESEKVFVKKAQEVREARVIIPDEQVKGEIKTNVVCHTDDLEYDVAYSFDCNDLVKNEASSESVTTSKKSEGVDLSVGRGKKYAFIEYVYEPHHEQDVENIELMFNHEVSDPNQQSFSVFYEHDDVWKPVCNTLEVDSTKEQQSKCDLKDVYDNKELKLRIEAYAPEGKAEWKVKGLEVKVGYNTDGLSLEGDVDKVIDPFFLQDEIDPAILFDPGFLTSACTYLTIHGSLSPNFLPLYPVSLAEAKAFCVSFLNQQPVLPVPGPTAITAATPEVLPADGGGTFAPGAVVRTFNRGTESSAEITQEPESTDTIVPATTPLAVLNDEDLSGITGAAIIDRLKTNPASGVVAIIFVAAILGILYVKIFRRS